MNSGRDYVAVKARFFSSIQTDSSNNCYKMGLKINNNENRTTASPCAEKYARKRGMICVCVGIVVVNTHTHRYIVPKISIFPIKKNPRNVQ